jgi:hypothetical protein
MPAIIYNINSNYSCSTVVGHNDDIETVHQLIGKQLLQQQVDHRVHLQKGVIDLNSVFSVVSLMRCYNS